MVEGSTSLINIPLWMVECFHLWKGYCGQNDPFCTAGHKHCSRGFQSFWREGSHYSVGNSPQSDKGVTSVGIFLEKKTKNFLLVIVTWLFLRWQNSVILNKMNYVFYYHSSFLKLYLKDFFQFCKVDSKLLKTFSLPFLKKNILLSGCANALEDFYFLLLCNAFIQQLLQQC